jgi:hypothetical protein
MKITKKELANIIKEEIAKALSEQEIDVDAKKSLEAEARALRIPTENEFIKAARDRLIKNVRLRGWWGVDTKYTGNMNLWASDMRRKYRENIGQHMDSVRKKQGNQKDANPVAKDPAVDKKPDGGVQKRAPFPSFKHWFELNKKKYPKGNRGLKIALEVYGVKKARYERYAQRL